MGATKGGLRVLHEAEERPPLVERGVLVASVSSIERDILESFGKLGENAAAARWVKDSVAFNVSALSDRAVALVRRDGVGLLNNDTEATSPEWRQGMVCDIE